MNARLRWALPTGALVLAGIGILGIVQANRAVEEAIVDVAKSGIAATLRPVSEAVPPGVDFLSASPDFIDGRLFQESLYLSGAGGIWAYDLAGNLHASYLVGRDLPPSPPVAMAVGSVTGAAEPRLWIGTSDGILLFDGTRFSEIRIEQEGVGNVTSLLMLPTGVLLVGFSKAGVMAYDGVGIAPFHSTLQDIPVTVLAGEAGDLWIGTRDRGVIHWHGGSAEVFGLDTGLLGDHVLSITTERDRAFVGTPLGVSEFRDGHWVRNVAEGVLASSLLQTDDHLLIGTLDEGVIDVRLDGIRPPSFGQLSGFQPVRVRQLFEIQGRAFALTEDSLLEWAAGTGLWAELIRANAVWTDRNVSALAIDRAGRLWVGYFDRGLDIAAGPELDRVIHIEDDQLFCINRIVPDPYREALVVATANGMVLLGLEGEVLRRVGASDGLISEHVTDVAIDADGLAVATAGGVTLMDPAGPQSIYAFHGLVNNHVYTLGQRGSDIYAGTLGGLSLIRDGFVRESFTTSNSPLRHNWISAVVDSNGVWFVGTYGGGILRLDSESWEEFPDIPAGTVINPNAMLAGHGRVFAGTLGDGLLVYSEEAGRWTARRQGLPSPNVTALAASDDRLYVGTDNGVVSMPLPEILR